MAYFAILNTEKNPRLG